MASQTQATVINEPASGGSFGVKMKILLRKTLYGNM
jgi:hypothetical protein